MNSKNASKKMIGNDKAIEYKSMFHKVEHVLEGIKEMGFDVSKYEELLGRIDRDTKQENAHSFNSEMMVDGRLIINYSNALERLENLLGVLSKYDIYAKAINTCRYVTASINKDNNLQQIKYYANLVISALKNIKSSETMYFKEEEKIIEEIYEVAYNVIKLEIMITGKSEIYEYVKLNENDKYFFDKYIKNDLDMFNLDDDRYKNIKSRLYYIKGNGLSTSYFDLELIKTIVLYGDNQFKETIILKMNELEKEIYRNGIKILNSLKEYETLEEKKKELKKTLNKHKWGLSKRIISLVLSTSLFLGGGYGIFRLTKGGTSKTFFNAETTYYSEYTGKTNKTSEVVEVYTTDAADKEDKVIIEMYSPLEQRKIGDPIRKCKKYLLYGELLDSVYDYLEYDLSFLIPSSEATYYYDKEEQEINEKEFRTVEMIDYTNLEEIKNYDVEFWFFLMLFEILYLLATWGIYASVSYINDRTKFKNIFKKIKEDLNSIKEYKKLTNEQLLNILEHIKEMVEIVNLDEEKRLEFMKMYTENKFLLENPNELMKRINNIKFDEGKKRVRTLRDAYK